MALRSYIALPWFCYLAAEAYVAAGRLREAFEMARKGIDFASKGAERFFESKNHRLPAVILAKDPDVKRQQVEAHFDEALRLARSQKAKSLELRTAVSFVRIACERGGRNRARKLLSPIYASFTEGFDTADLREAKAVLEALSLS